MNLKKKVGSDSDELQIHQIELENLKEELRLIQQELGDLTLSGDQRFRLMLEKIPNIAVQAYGADGTVKYWNKASETIYGYSEEEAVGKTLYDLIIPQEAQPFVRASVAAAVSSGVDIPPGELMLRHKDGSYVAVYSSHVVIRASGAEPQLFCIDIDMNERKQMDQALRESEEQYRFLANNIPDSVYSLDGEGNIVSVSSSAFARYGYSEQDVKGKPFFSFVHPEDHEILITSFVKAIADKRKVTTGLQFRILAENGVGYWVELNSNARFDNSGRYLGEEGVLRDITDRKQAEMAQRRNAETQILLREIAEAALKASSMTELYETVHRLIARVVPNKLFNISLLDEVAGEIVVPYRSEEAAFLTERRPICKGLTEYFIRLGRSAYLKPDDLARLRETGEYTLGKLQNIHIQHFLGAPLINSEGTPFGVIVLALLDDAQVFQTEDVETFTIIAAQVSMAIERKQAEEALANSETMQKSILRAAPVGIGLVRHRVIQSVNEKLCGMTGYAETELVGQSSRMLYPSQEEYELVGAEKYRQIAAFGTGTVETKWQRKDGTIIDVWLSSTPFDSADLGRGVTFTALDITTRKFAENALRESEERYRAVLEQSPEAVFLCNPDTAEIVETNSRFTALFGYDLRRDGPLFVFDLTVDRRENVAAYLTQAQRDGFLPLQRRVVRHKNGIEVQVDRTARLVRYRDRSLLVQTMRDVTEEVRREQDLQRDAELATRVQTAMLTEAEASVHLEIATIYEPSSYVGGDLYFMDWRYGGNLLRGFLIDAAGHGLATALHTSAMHVLLREVNELDLPLAEQMRWLNHRAGQYYDEATFAGAVGFELDLQLRQLRWCCAGMPHIWLATQDRQGIVTCPGMYLGICQAETFEMHTTPISAGDSVCFMTDGLSEISGLQAEMQNVGYADMVSLLKKISVSGECRDDATAVCIRVNSLPDSAGRTDGWPRVLRFNGYGDYQRLKGEVGKILAEVTGLSHSLQEVAVHEALANAMECRDGVPRQHKARLRFNKVGDRLIVRVKTSRMGFAGNAVLRRLRSHPDEMFSFGEDASMGRGVPLMLTIAHKMTYNNEGTEVLLAWRLKNGRA